MLEWLNRVPRPLALLGGLVLVGLVGLLDYLTGYEISFSIFYVIPIVLVTWTIGRRAGVALALLGAATWYLVEYLGGRLYSNPIIPYWNALVRLSFFLIIVLSLAALKELWQKEKDLSRVDFLTGIANSKAFYEWAEQELERCFRYRRPLSLAYLDCDNFKEINTGSATSPAISCCARWRTSSKPTCAPPTSARAWAATSSPSCCPRPERPRPRRWSSG